VTLVDDGSTDESRHLLATDYPEVSVIPLHTNHGLAAAINIALAHTSNPFVVLLNNDTEVEPTWLAELVGGLERYPDYDFAASKLLLFDRRDVLHAAGDGYTPSGRPFNRGVWQPDHGQYDVLTEVWGACAGAAAYRRSALQSLAVDGQVFDVDLFMYCEDVDLNLRARLAGIRTLFIPTAVVYHRLSATGGGALSSYYCGRNFITVWAKNMPALLIWRHFVAFVVYQLTITLDAMWHGSGEAARARLRGQLAGLRALPHFLRKRRTRRQRITDQEFARWLGC
jgi:GT2 family glycosyltransferase